MNLKVILTKDVSGLGRVGETKEVSVGYARNFLMSKGFARLATDDLVKKLNKEAAEQSKKLDADKTKLQQIKKDFANKTFTLKAKASKKNLFAAVSAKQIAEITGFRPEQIKLLAPIKSLGQHEVEIEAFPNMRIKLNLTIEPDNA
jgi:large subunit ribosomal protein L9